MPELAHEPKKNQRNYSARTGKHCQMTLRRYVELWPTPSATDHKGSGKTGELRDRMDYAVESGGTKSKAYEQPSESGQLNPEWVEWLMGFPIGWTDLNA